MDRRTFLKVGSATGAGFVLQLFLAPSLAAEDTSPVKNDFPPDIWLRITPDDRIFITVARSEMGQGVYTAIPMVVAEELDVDWAKVRAEQASADPRYGDQTTGGSRSIRNNWDELRKMGASAREMLKAAAAETWGVSAGSCRTENSFVIHAQSGRKASYGSLIAKAAKIPIPAKVPLKNHKDYKIIGKDIPRLDIAEKVNGSARFGIDVQLPGMLYATVERCPIIGGKVASFDASKAKKTTGVRDVFAIPSGIAVVADSYWAAAKARRSLKIEWDKGKFADLSSEKISAIYRRRANDQGRVGQSIGDAPAVVAQAKDKIESDFEVPYLAHVTMEPMNCTAHVSNGFCKVWAPTQSTNRARDAAMRITGLPQQKVEINTTLLGGGFGRRLFQDYVEEAVHIAKKTQVPVKLLWSREDDIRHDFYRNGTYHKLSAAIENGKLTAWFHRVVGPSTLRYWDPSRMKNGYDPTLVRGATDQPYDIANFYVDSVEVGNEVPVPVGWWRAVDFARSAFVNECFLDHIAAHLGKDPYRFRRELLHKAPRYLRLLDMVAEKAGWDKPLPKGQHRGIALHYCFGGYAAEVAEVSVDDSGNVKVHRIVGVMDCGTCINPDIVRAQVESGVIDALGYTFKSVVTFQNGQVEQSNFHNYPLMRIHEVPKIEAYVMPSTEHPGGVGEVSIPPVAPAVANAIFAATGKKITKLPIVPGDIVEQQEEAW